MLYFSHLWNASKWQNTRAPRMKTEVSKVLILVPESETFLYVFWALLDSWAGGSYGASPISWGAEVHRGPRLQLKIVFKSSHIFEYSDRLYFSKFTTAVFSVSDAFQDLIFPQLRNGDHFPSPWTREGLGDCLNWQAEVLIPEFQGLVIRGDIASPRISLLKLGSPELLFKKSSYPESTAWEHCMSMPMSMSIPYSYLFS